MKRQLRKLQQPNNTDGGFGLVEVLLAGSLGAIVASGIASTMAMQFKQQAQLMARDNARGALEVAAERVKQPDNHKLISVGESCSLMWGPYSDEMGAQELTADCSATAKSTIRAQVKRWVPCLPCSQQAQQPEEPV